MAQGYGSFMKTHSRVRALCLYRISRFLGFTFVALLWAGHGLAMGSETAGWIGLSVMEFGYKEFGDRGELLNREDGLLPGLTLGVVQTWNNWFGGLEGSINSGEVTYDGRTQSGIPLETDTDERIIATALQLGYWFNRPKSFNYALYGGLGYRYWRRDIQPTALTDGSPIAGLLETYQWKYGLLGIKIKYNQSDIVHWKIDVQLMRTIDPEIEVDFQGFEGFDDTRLELNEKYGTSINISWNYAYNKTQSLEITPFYEQWDLGRSPEKTLTSNGVPVGLHIFEPRSETRNIGISIMLKLEL
jgi:hypothetical protein